MNQFKAHENEQRNQMISKTEKENAMSIQTLIDAKSPLKDESQDVQKAAMCFAYYLCRTFVSA